MGFLINATISLLVISHHSTVAQLQCKPETIGICKSSSKGECFSRIDREQLHKKVIEIVTKNIVPQFHKDLQLIDKGLYCNFPADSCADIFRGHPSGYYWLNVSDRPRQFYCSVNETRCCNGSDGNWMRIAYLNMSDPSQQCPDSWREIDSPIRTCRRQANTSINSVKYSSHGIPYSRVCGRIIGYQYGTPEAFLGYLHQNQTTLDVAYVDGISITYGQRPRHHIWTLAAGKGTYYYLHTCPCDIPYTSSVTAPPFINEDYFCERGTFQNPPDPDFVDSNPLWDGDGCTDSSTCCEFNNPPWFYKQLTEPTTEDIEIRLMTSAVDHHRLEAEDTPVELIEIFIQ